MPSAQDLAYLLIHPNELRSIIQWKVWHNPVHERDESKQTESTKICFKYLHKTSRSFAAVIEELHPDLLIPICLFYLILRGLDTVEDDTSIPIKIKEPILRDFYQNLEVDGWHFDGNRPEEKDRDLLVDFKYVVEEFKKQKPAYKEVISDICKRMGNGMADYVLKADQNIGIVTVADYDLYCFYVAGLVGEGLTRMFVESTYGNPALLKRPHLHKSMGLFLQKTNIIRDVREDSDDDRFFWPEEIWKKHVDNWDDLFKPEHKQVALECQSEMIYNALCHADECLFYLAGLKEQSVFNFCAIPQSMAIATLALCFQNYAMFERNIKISKGQACQLMVESTQNLNMVCDNFRKYVHIIRKKNNPRDPCFLKISIQCGKIEQFIESVFPSQSAEDARARQAAALSENDQAAKEKRDAMAYEARWDTIWIGIAVFGTMFAIMGLMFGAAWLMGARWDSAEIMKSLNKSPGQSPPVIVQQQPNRVPANSGPAHGEL